MASTCFCGCGRDIKGIRRRANNAVAQKMSEQLAVLRGASEKGEVGDDGDEVTALVTQGSELLDSIRAFVHEEAGRSDVDKDATKAWLDKADAMADTLLRQSRGLPWEPDDPTTAHLAQSGVRAPGVITDVQRDGWGNERVASLRMTVSLEPADGPPFEATRTLSIAVVKAPRVGDRVEVSYDRSDPNRFVYRPTIEQGSGDRIERLRALGDLLEDGLLTRDEFEAEKARLLAE